MSDKDKKIETNNIIIDSSYEENHISPSFHKLNKELQDELIDMMDHNMRVNISRVLKDEKEYIFEEAKKIRKTTFIVLFFFACFVLCIKFL
jgi:hypothetical protein